MANHMKCTHPSWSIDATFICDVMNHGNDVGLKCDYCNNRVSTVLSWYHNTYITTQEDDVEAYKLCHKCKIYKW